MTHALKRHARAAGKKVDCSMHYFRSGGGGNHKGLGRGRRFLHHGGGFLQEAQYGMVAHEDHGRRVPRRGRKRVGERGLGRTVQVDQRILVE